MKSLFVNDYKVDIVLLRTDVEKIEKQFCILVERNGQLKSMEITGSYYTPDEGFALPTGNQLFLMLNDQLLLFDPETMEITKRAELDILGTMIAAYPYKDDFILHGEIEILRVNKELKVLWSFSGLDIFVRRSRNEQAITFQEDRICLYDFYENYYEIDYHGTLKRIVKKEHEVGFREI